VPKPKPARDPRFPPLTIEQQRYLAFEGLLGWTASVLRQARRIGSAQQQIFVRQLPPTKPEELQRWLLARRLAMMNLQTEQHFFCVAANKLLDHRLWIRRLKLLDESVFEELDKFTEDIKVIRNMREHAIEYYEGPGQKPQHWGYEGEDFLSTPTGTVNTLLGGRLDWVALANVAERLFAKISVLGPFYPPHPRRPQA
jgi:hypothetical protein